MAVYYSVDLAYNFKVKPALECLQEKLLHDYLLAHINVAIARAYEQLALDCLENKMVSDEEREDGEDAAQIDCEFIHSQL